MYMAGRIALPVAASRFRRGGAVSAAGGGSVERIANAQREETRRAGRVEGRVAQRVAPLGVGRKGLRNETTGGVEAGRAELGGGRGRGLEGLPRHERKAIARRDDDRAGEPRAGVVAAVAGAVDALAAHEAGVEEGPGEVCRPGAGLRARAELDALSTRLAEVAEIALAGSVAADE